MEILRYIFPQVECWNCKAQIYNNMPLCPDCYKEFEKLKKKGCITGEFVKGHVIYLYEGIVKEMIVEFKYKNKRYYGAFFAELMAKQVKMMGIEFSAVIPVPAHRKRKWMRGYNQAAILAKEISKICDIYYDDKFLTRIKNTLPMKEINQKERLLQLQDAFVVRNDKNYKNILIIDDIYTTGSTIDACGKVLYQANIDQVIFIVFSGNY